MGGWATWDLSQVSEGETPRLLPRPYRTQPCQLLTRRFSYRPRMMWGAGSPWPGSLLALET